MPTYQATIRHSNIPHARTIEIDGTLTQAKRAAAVEFIANVLNDGDRRIIASRFVGSRRWKSWPWPIHV